jgi:Asparagine synthase
MLQQRRLRLSKQGTPDWLAPDIQLQQQMQERLVYKWEQKIPQTEAGGFYFSELQETFNHPLTTIEMEEVFENGARMGLHILMPYWDADLIEMLYRVSPNLLLKGGRSKGLVRESMARRFPNLGFERQKKVIATNFFNNTMLEEGRKAWQVMGGTPALAELGIVDSKRLQVTMTNILAANQPRQEYRIWDILNAEAWLKSCL